MEIPNPRGGKNNYEIVMKFQNPIFREGLMQTTRKGTEWNKGTNGYVRICNGENKFIGGIWIVYSHTFKFKDIPEPEIAMNHDPGCRSRSGLLKAMKRFYPGFNEDDVVTLVYFTKE